MAAGAARKTRTASSAAVAASAKQPYAYAGPPNVTALIKEGEEVWEVLSDMRSMPTDPKDLIAWLEEIAKQLLGGGGSGRFERTAPEAQPTH